ncbi:hypothetical protein RYH80_18220 [Halobaculum sp. MBLA0147]|uniref:hypothetical protein n=1 Tax=Halobaculum sp. MBLA0147 TaxID=3079934 RepID=UPI0035232A38
MSTEIMSTTNTDSTAQSPASDQPHSEASAPDTTSDAVSEATGFVGDADTPLGTAEQDFDQPGYLLPGDTVVINGTIRGTVVADDTDDSVLNGTPVQVDTPIAGPDHIELKRNPTDISSYIDDVDQDGYRGRGVTITSFDVERGAAPSPIDEGQITAAHNSLVLKSDHFDSVGVTQTAWTVLLTDYQLDGARLEPTDVSTRRNPRPNGFLPVDWDPTKSAVADSRYFGSGVGSNPDTVVADDTGISHGEWVVGDDGLYPTQHAIPSLRVPWEWLGFDLDDIQSLTDDDRLLPHKSAPTAATDLLPGDDFSPDTLGVVDAPHPMQDVTELTGVGTATAHTMSGYAGPIHNSTLSLDEMRESEVIDVEEVPREEWSDEYREAVEAHDPSDAPDRIVGQQDQELLNIGDLPDSFLADFSDVSSSYRRTAIRQLRGALRRKRDVDDMQDLGLRFYASVHRDTLRNRFAEPLGYTRGAYLEPNPDTDDASLVVHNAEDDDEISWIVSKDDPQVLADIHSRVVEARTDDDTPSPTVGTDQQYLDPLVTLRDADICDVVDAVETADGKLALFSEADWQLSEQDLHAADNVKTLVKESPYLQTVSEGTAELIDALANVNIEYDLAPVAAGPDTIVVKDRTFDLFLTLVP